MHVVNGLGLKGSYKNEQAFKMDWIAKSKERGLPDDIFFEVENEEKEPGFPDVMKIGFTQKVSFYEMKITSANGTFKMQPTQPLFYRTHPTLDISVMVYSNETRKLYCISGEELYKTALKKDSLVLRLEDFENE